MRPVNALLVRWAHGWLEVTDAASIAAHDRHEDFLSVGDAPSPEEAQRRAEAILATTAWPVEDITLVAEPIGPSDTPGIGVLLGDVVTAPDAGGDPQSYRMVGVTVTEDDEGNAIVSPQLRRV